MPERCKGMEEYPEFEQMSIDELEALLRADFVLNMDEPPDTSYIMAITEVIEKREKEDSTTTPADVDEAWQRFQMRRSLLQLDGITQEPNPHHTAANETPPEIKMPRPKSKTRKFLPRILAAALLLGLLIPSVNGMNIFAILAKWSEEVFQLEADGKKMSSTVVSANDPMKTLRRYVAERTDVSVIPNWSPDGTVEQRARVVQETDSTRIHASYSCPEGEFKISVSVYPSAAEVNEKSYENDNSDIPPYIANGQKYYIIGNLDTSTITWTVANLEVQISGNLSVEELKQMVDSIKMENEP